MSKEKFSFDDRPRLRSTWNATRLLVRRRLTDRKIEQYRKAGWYSEAFREARRELWESKKAKADAARVKREGNFEIRDGRMIYNPL